MIVPWVVSVLLVSSGVASSAIAADTSASAADTTSFATPDSVVLLPEVRVESQRPARSARERLPSGFTTELQPRAAGRAFETLADLLAESPGVRVSQYGGLGAFSTLSLRGAPAGQVAVYLDGTPLQSGAHSVVDLSDLPFAPVERVEVYRGVTPLALGASPGGAIQLVTRTASGSIGLHVARGSFDTWEAHGEGGARRGPWSLVLDGAYQGSDGDFEFDDDNGTPFNPNDDETSVRVNNRHDAAQGMASLGWLAPLASSVTLRHHQFYRAHGVPGLGVDPALNARLEMNRSLEQVEIARPSATLVPALIARGSYQRDRSQYTNTEFGLVPTDRDDRFESALGALEARWPGGTRPLAIEGSVSRRAERYEPHDALDPRGDPPASTRDADAATAGVTLETLHGALLLRAAQRWDRIDDRLHRFSSFGAPVSDEVTHEVVVPQLGSRVRLPLGAELRGNWTRAERVPDFTELFGDQGGVQGNPTLRPEQGENWDAGMRFERAAGRTWNGFLEIVHFESDAEGLIVYLPNTPGTVRASNVSHAEIVGDELALRLEATGGFSLSAAGTSMRAVDRGSVRAWYGKRLPGRPDRTATVHLDWRRAPLRIGASVDYIGENYLDPSNRRRVDARTLVGATASFSLRGDALRFTLEGRNLGDERASDVGGYPLPGRMLYASIEARVAPGSHGS